MVQNKNYIKYHHYLHVFIVFFSLLYCSWYNEMWSRNVWKNVAHHEFFFEKKSFIFFLYATDYTNEQNW